MSTKVDTLLISPGVATTGQVLMYNGSTNTWAPSSINTLVTNIIQGNGGTVTNVETSPVGSVMFYAGSAAPVGWFECYGQSLSAATYVDLFKVIGYLYGNNGPNMFKVPDLRGEFIRGWDHGRNIDPLRVFGTSQGDDFKSHSHTAPTTDGFAGNYEVPFGSPAILPRGYDYILGAPTSATGGLETRPRNVALLPCIKYTTVAAATGTPISNNNTTISIPNTPGLVSTLAGLAGQTGTTDGTGAGARFTSPYGITSDSLGNIYVSDNSVHTIRKITPQGVVVTFAGLAGQFGTTNGTGSAARFNMPLGLATDSANNIYATDRNNNTIRKITPEGAVTTFVGSAIQSGSTDGTGYNALFYVPSGITSSPNGDLYVTDTYNHTIRKITLERVVTTFAGSVGVIGSTNGTGTNSSFNFPVGITTDPAGNLYICDSENHLIRKITSTGVVSTFAGSNGNAGSTDGTGTNAKFFKPLGITSDSSGNLYVVDSGNSIIRKITPQGVVTTLAGVAKVNGSTDGVGNAARFKFPLGITNHPSGDLYVADLENYTIRKISGASSGGTVIINTVFNSDTAFTSNGNAKIGIFADAVCFTSSTSGTGTWTAPDGCYSARVTVVGSGASDLGAGNRSHFNYPSGVTPGLNQLYADGGTSAIGGGAGWNGVNVVGGAHGYGTGSNGGNGGAGESMYGGRGVGGGGGGSAGKVTTNGYVLGWSGGGYGANGEEPIIGGSTVGYGGGSGGISTNPNFPRNPGPKHLGGGHLPLSQAVLNLNTYCRAMSGSLTPYEKGWPGYGNCGAGGGWCTALVDTTPGSVYEYGVGAFSRITGGNQRQGGPGIVVIEW